MIAKRIDLFLSQDITAAITVPSETPSLIIDLFTIPSSALAVKTTKRRNNESKKVCFIICNLILLLFDFKNTQNG
jgi:hypothetical protein